MELTSRQQEILYGTLLGDGCITKLDYQYATYYRFEVEHTAKDRNYVNWLYNELKEIFNSEARFRTRHSNLGTRGIKSESLSLYSKMHNIFHNLREELYPNGIKTVTPDWLNKLSPLSLAVWYMDDGSYHINSNTIELSTYSFSLSEHHSMQEYFMKAWDIDATIAQRNTGQRKHYYLYFPRDEATKLLKIISPHILPCMARKLPVGWDRATQLPANFHLRIKDYKCPNNKKLISDNLISFYKQQGEPHKFPVVLYNYTKDAYSYKAITAIFGSWENALKEADLPVGFM